jgi:hypothetical protein
MRFHKGKENGMPLSLGPAFAEGYKGVGKYAGDKALDWVSGEGPLLDLKDYIRVDPVGGYERMENSARSEQFFADEHDKEVMERRKEQNRPVIDQYLQETQDDQVRRLRELYLRQIK